jgi:SNF family Na+-dependent transporter
LALRNNRLYALWRLLVRYVVPVAIALVFVVNL